MRPFKASALQPQCWLHTKGSGDLRSAWAPTGAARIWPWVGSARRTAAAAAQRRRRWPHPGAILSRSLVSSSACLDCEFADCWLRLMNRSAAPGRGWTQRAQSPERHPVPTASQDCSHRTVLIGLFSPLLIRGRLGWDLMCAATGFVIAQRDAEPLSRIAVPDTSVLIKYAC